MADRILYSITSLFKTPDEIIRAAGATRAAGYEQFDVHTPYPVHGMDAAMNLKPSKIGRFAFVFGLLGAISAIGFMTWTTVVDYPLMIGGKPFWAWPAYVPISFELTVLATAVLSTIAMIVFYFKFPNNAHPLHDTAYMKRVSADAFGISIQASDPKFDEKKVKAFLINLGGQNVGPVYYDAEDFSKLPKLFDVKFLALVVVVGLVSSAASYWSFNKLMYLQPFNWMEVQAKQNVQQPSNLFKDGIGMRRPVEGTVARGFLPYPYAGVKADSVPRFLVNPLPATSKVIALGKVRYLTYCSPCHGNFARGDSRLQGQFPSPPTLQTDQVRNWPDGRIYHIITVGQNAMPSYAAQISREDRWAIIRYIRVLQRAQNAKESDLR